MRASFTFSRHDPESNSELKSEFASGSVVFLIFPPACCSKIPKTPRPDTVTPAGSAANLGVAEAAPAEEKRLTGEAMLLMTLERNGHENCRTRRVHTGTRHQEVSAAAYLFHLIGATRREIVATTGRNNCLDLPTTADRNLEIILTVDAASLMPTNRNQMTDTIFNSNASACKKDQEGYKIGHRGVCATR